MPTDLRPYQRECIKRVLASYKSGLRRVLVSLPTGTGKTVVFASFPRELAMKKKMLILAHRDELLEQAREKLLTAAPDVTVGVEQAERRASPDAQVVIGSVPTLGRANSKRLAALKPEEFSIVVVDESGVGRDAARVAPRSPGVAAQRQHDGADELQRSHRRLRRASRRMRGHGAADEVAPALRADDRPRHETVSLDRSSSHARSRQ